MNETILIQKPILSNGREWVDSHNYVRSLQSKVVEIRDDSSLSEHNRAALLAYCRSLAKKRPPTIVKNMQVTYRFIKGMGKDMGDAITKEDCERYYLNLINDPKIKPWTIKKYLLCIRRFFRVYYGLKAGHYPAQVDCWETSLDTREYLDPDVLPSQNQIKQAIEACNNTGALLEARNQFLIALVNDIGCRISEALSLNVGDIKEIYYEGHNLLLVKLPQSKTFPRTIVSLLSRPYLQRYFALRGITQGNVEQRKDEPLFLDRYKKRAEYRAVVKFIERAFQRIEYRFPKNRKVNMLRHCWLTRAGEHFKFAQKNYWCGQTGSHVSMTYTHFNWMNVVKPYLDMLIAEKNPMMVIKCGCGQENAGQEFCTKCAQSLTLTNALNKENTLNAFKKFAENMTEPEFEQYLLRLIRKNRTTNYQEPGCAMESLL